MVLRILIYALSWIIADNKLTQFFHFCKQRDPDFCKPWLYVNYFILLSYYVVLCIAFYFFSIHLDRNFYFFVLAFVFAFFIIAFKFNIVRKFIIELENETEGKDQNIAKNGTSLTQKSVGHYLPQQIFYKEATNP